jgi:hypothetical protein
VELLTIRIRLLVCSIDKAEEIGMNWWRSDPSYAGPAITAPEYATLSAKLDALTSKIERLEQKQVSGTPSSEI